MAYATQTHSNTTANILGRAANFFSNLSERSARYGTYRRTLDELSGLSDRELNDLGISRSMIKGIAYEAAYQS